MIDRNTLIEEYKLRMTIRKAIHNIVESETSKEDKLRSFIKKLIKEDAEKSPHRSTGINVLEDLLKKIVPQLEQDYKKLTTDADQRESFRTHVINAVQNALAPSKASAEASDKQISIDEEEGDITMSVGEEPADSESPDEEAFIDIDGGTGEDELSDEENFAIGAEGDETGRNMAFTAFERIEKSIIDSYGLLANNEDRELFYDYLLTNLKLYFDKFESELDPDVAEPTTQSYEDEKEELEAEEGEEELEL